MVTKRLTKYTNTKCGLAKTEKIIYPYVTLISSSATFSLRSSCAIGISKFGNSAKFCSNK